uniref:ATP synthase F0 subunit 8 n=1 Tax=Sclerodermus sichuanensis TaxID=592144 RepID=UPI002113D7FC|nr:ATP synthase F0 subunit 8 [Sclerodermus sichuanensis]UTN43171.1 ATP synthase F0 subunit 8 [Sclerodermus sichuanensis]
MPMMKPMLWLFIMILTWLILTLFNTILFFKFNEMPLNKDKLNKNNFSLNLKW